MTTIEWLVVAAAVAAIGWVNWYFFLAGGRAVESRAEKGAGGRARKS